MGTRTLDAAPDVENSTSPYCRECEHDSPADDDYPLVTRVRAVLGLRSNGMCAHLEEDAGFPEEGKCRCRNAWHEAHTVAS